MVLVPDANRAADAGPRAAASAALPLAQHNMLLCSCGAAAACPAQAPPVSDPDTPATACRRASITPAAGALAPATALAAEVGTTAAASAASCEAAAVATAAAQRGQQQQQQQVVSCLDRRIQSFIACMAASPLIQSALLALECDGSHPPPAGAPEPAPGAAPAGTLEATLAQLLALFLRTGHNRGARWRCAFTSPPPLPPCQRRAARCRWRLFSAPPTPVSRHRATARCRSLRVAAAGGPVDAGGPALCLPLLRHRLPLLVHPPPCRLLPYGAWQAAAGAAAAG